jgi:uncharacterized membrane protein
MSQRDFYKLPYRPEIGCVLLVVLMALMCLTPFLFIEAMRGALDNLHLHASAAAAVIFGILIGGFVNFPVARIERGLDQPPPLHRVYTSMGWIPVLARQPTQTIIAVNLGGCILPVLIALYELPYVFGHSQGAVVALVVAVSVNVGLCYFLARPMPGIGIAMPAFASPAAAIGVTWLLLWPVAFDDVRAPVAFVAGISGPLIGADLLHLRHFARLSAGVVSIGGAGTFDGIVISGMLAALLTSRPG